MKNESLWVELYRPKTVSECILPEEIKKIFQQYVDRKEIPNLLLAGTPGVGKTTIAKALCREVGCDYIMLNGSDENGIDTFRNKIKNYASSVSFMGGKKVIIIDEGDFLNPNSIQPALRGALEEFSHNCTFIITCNYKNRIIEALRSRFAVVDFKIKNADKPKMAALFMKRASFILKEQEVEFNPEVLAELVKKYFPDYRKVLNELQKYSMMDGKIDTGILSAIADVSLSDLIKSLKEKNFSSMRKWVGENAQDDAANIYRKIYDSMYTFIEKSTIPNVVIILAKYQYQSAFVSDQELNLVACLTEIMCEAEFV